MAENSLHGQAVFVRVLIVNYCDQLLWCNVGDYFFQFLD